VGTCLDARIELAREWGTEQRVAAVVGARRRRSVLPDARLARYARSVPRFSLVIPAWNEEAYLPRLLASVGTARLAYSAEPGAVEVIVADNASTDATASVARERGCRVAAVAKRRIGAARNGGAALATGEILCFVDADTVVHPETFVEIDEVMGTGRYVAGATGVRMERWSAGIVVTWCLMMPLVFATGMDTGVVFCRRADFESIGGYNEVRHYGEDVELLWSLRRLGKKRRQRLVRLRRSKAIASARKFDRHGDWHYFTLAARAGLDMIRDPGALSDHARRYWYEDERDDPRSPDRGTRR
jgi:glycosyltransferase involved in cell wall biosynthesis